jgi:hypothetical protein
MEPKQLTTPSLLKRRGFLFGALSSLATYPLLRAARASAIGMLGRDTIPLNIGAAQMGPRANALRLDFVSTHMTPTPRVPVPLAKIFHAASMLPTDKKKGEKLLSRQDLKWQGDRLVSTSPDKLTAPFKAIMCGVVINLYVTFPKVIDISVDYQNDTLRFTFNQAKTNPILFTLLTELPECDGVSVTIGDQQILSSLAVSPNAAVITTIDKNQTASQFELTLDFMRSTKTNLRTASALLTALWKRFSFLSILLMYVFTIGFYASCGPPGEPPPPGTNKCPVTQETVCPTLTGPPEGFLIVDLKYAAGSSCGDPGGLQPNTWIIECYDEKEKDCEMTICATPNIPTGWALVRTKSSNFGCWFGTGSAVNNIYVIKRTGNKPAVPKCGRTSDANTKKQ